MRFYGQAKRAQTIVQRDSQTDLFHSIRVAPQISFTRTCRPPCSLSMRFTSAHFVGDEMVYPDCDPAAAGLIHKSCGLFYGLWPVHFRSFGVARAPSDVDGRSGRT